MELVLTPDQEFFAETTAKYLEDKASPTTCAPLHDPAGFSPAYWRQGAELGWTSLLVSEDHGGGSISGGGVLDLVLVADEFGRLASPGPLLATNVVAAARRRRRLRGAEGRRAAGSVEPARPIATWCWPEPRPCVERGRRPGRDRRHDGRLRPQRREVHRWRRPARPTTSSSRPAPTTASTQLLVPAGAGRA